MATITRRTTGDGVRYDVRYDTTTNGKRSQRRRSFTTKAEARRFADRTGTALAEGSYLDPKKARRVTVAEYADDCLAAWAPTLRRTKLASDTSIVRARIRPFFGDLALAAVTPEVVEEFQTWLGADRGLAPSTVETTMIVLGKVFGRACRPGDGRLLAANPCDHVDGVRVPRHEARHLDEHEVDALADAIDERYRALVIVGADAALRIGELFGLTYGDLDLDGRVGRGGKRRRPSLTVRHNVTRVNGIAEVGEPKTAAGRRRVPLTRKAVAALDKHRANAADTRPGALVFPTPSGAPMPYDRFRARYWRPAVEAAGVGPVVLHELRHTGVGVWLSNGADPARVAKWAGHTSTSTILDRYAYMLDDDDDPTFDTIDDAREVDA